MFERIRKWFYARWARRCEKLGHQRVIAERAGRKDGLYVIEQRIQCERCSAPLSDWIVVLSEKDAENAKLFWMKTA